MTGSDSVKVPEQSHSFEDLGNKKVSDLISADTAISPEGKVTGTINYIGEPWKEFDQNRNNTGHFFPVKLPDECIGQNVVCKGRVNGDRTVMIDDGYVITRLENLLGDTCTFEMKGETVATLDFSSATKTLPVGKYAFDLAKTNYGDFGDFSDATTVLSWDGTDCNVTGEVLYMETATATKLSEDGNYFPFALKSEFYDGKNITVISSSTKTAAFTDWVIKLEKTSDTITVKDGETVIAVFKFTGATLEAAG